MADYLGHWRNQVIHCNNLRELHHRGSPPKRLARPAVEQVCNLLEPPWIIHWEVSSFGEVLAQQTVGVLVASPLPRWTRITEMDLHPCVDRGPRVLRTRAVLAEAVAWNPEVVAYLTGSKTFLKSSPRRCRSVAKQKRSHTLRKGRRRGQRRPARSIGSAELRASPTTFARRRPITGTSPLAMFPPQGERLGYKAGRVFRILSSWVHKQP